jgi:hypothetical protein
MKNSAGSYGRKQQSPQASGNILTKGQVVSDPDARPPLVALARMNPSDRARQRRCPLRTRSIGPKRSRRGRAPPIWMRPHSSSSRWTIAVESQSRRHGRLRVPRRRTRTAMTRGLSSQERCRPPLVLAMRERSRRVQHLGRPGLATGSASITIVIGPPPLGPRADPDQRRSHALGRRRQAHPRQGLPHVQFQRPPPAPPPRCRRRDHHCRPLPRCLPWQGTPDDGLSTCRRPLARRVAPPPPPPPPPLAAVLQAADGEIPPAEGGRQCHHRCPSSPPSDTRKDEGGASHLLWLVVAWPCYG